MGVRGLFSFTQSNVKCDFFQSTTLKDTCLIIDGNNLRYFLYNRMKKRNCAYGGEYHLYYQSVQNYFKTLLKCLITPIVIIDGSFEEGKKKTRNKRTKEQLYSALYCNPVTQGQFSVMPIFAKDIFLDAIRSLQIEIVQTYGEADKYMAHQASRVLNCPVLSNDSDFIIYESVELIQLSSVDVGNSEATFGLKCKRFCREKFLDFYGLETDKLLPLCATLLGNDETLGKGQLASVTEKIFAQVKHEKSKSVCPKHRRFAAILKWLGREKTPDLDKALDKLLQPVPAGKPREGARDLVLDAMKMYTFSADISDCKSGNCDCILSLWNVSSAHIKDAFTLSLLPNWTMDVIRHKHFYFQTQVEDPELPSALVHCKSLLDGICQELLKNEDTNENAFVAVTTRGEGRKLTNMRMILSENNLNAKPICFEQLLKLWMETGIVKDMELSSVILYYLLVKHENIVDSIFFKLKEVKAVYDKETVHSLGNFQALLYFATVFNAILNPKDPPILDMKNWNGTNIYRFIHTYGPESVKELVRNEYGNEVSNDFDRLYNQFAKSTIPKIRKEKKRQIRKRQSKPLITKVIEDNISRETSEVESEDDDHLIDNRFRLLTLTT